MLKLKLNPHALASMAENMVAGFMLTSGGIAALHLFNII